MNTVSMNDTVRVKLNEKGLKILRNEHEQLRANVPSVGPWKEPLTDLDGYTSFQLWSLMQTFGPHIRLGFDPPFDTEIWLP